MGAIVWQLSKLESVAKIRILSDSAKYSYSFMYRMSRNAHLKKGIDDKNNLCSFVSTTELSSKQFALVAPFTFFN